MTNYLPFKTNVAINADNPNNATLALSLLVQELDHMLTIYGTRGHINPDTDLPIMAYTMNDDPEESYQAYIFMAQHDAPGVNLPEPAYPHDKNIVVRHTTNGEAYRIHGRIYYHLLRQWLMVCHNATEDNDNTRYVFEPANLLSTHEFDAMILEMRRRFNDETIYFDDNELRFRSMRNKSKRYTMLDATKQLQLAREGQEVPF